MPTSSQPLGQPLAQPLAVYVHWPFCKAKCPYCDFNSHVREAVDQAAWRAALLREIGWWAQKAPEGEVVSIFFGGGTPSLMPPETVGAIIDAVSRQWRMAEKVEITLEANPTSVEAERFRGYAQAGMNRLSLGVQSLRAEALKALGREHDVTEAKAAIALAQSVFPRMSYDLIYAREGQTPAEWETELEEAIALTGGTQAGAHLSLYQLTIEPGTQFYHRHAAGLLALPEETPSTEMFDYTNMRMATAGMPAYEISNYAQPGQESRHNLAYWRGEAYLGIGPGAHGRPDLAGQRHATQNLRSPEKWLAAVQANNHGLEPEMPLPIAARDAVEERVLMGLRLRDGLDAARLKMQTGQTPEEVLDADALAMLQKEGWIEADARGVRLTPKGWPLLNQITSKLLGG